MHKLSFTIILFLIAFYVHSQSPHGKSFKIDCAQCHTSSSWSIEYSKMQFNHDNTNFKLIGQHKTVGCKNCHITLDFKDKRQSCTECHTDMHNNTLGKDCARCHTPVSWIIKNTTEMHQQSRFPLLGAHRTVTCSSCHQSSSGLQFEPIGIECINCHQKDFQKTTSPNHVLDGYSTDCIECHNSGSASWNTKAIDHTFFPLTGGHAISCMKCHVSGSYTKLSTDCNNCHQVQYDKAPNHKQAGYPTDCAKCHTPTNWLQSSFNHTNTNFPLTGKHITTECALCHTNKLAGTSTVCNSCHQKNYIAAQVPSHTAAGIPNTCETCHSTSGWKPSAFNHTTTGFELKGGHKTVVQCSDCHKGNLTAAKPECITCHQVQFDNAPNHKQGGYSTNCVSCHSSGSITWKNAQINHSFFPLTAGHAISCIQCHVTDTYGKIPADCKSCHQKNYNAAQIPNHTVAGIPNTCETCHTTSGWKPSSFNHISTGFELKGGHKTVVQCSDCHKGNLTTAAPECIKCHQVQYDNAPSHKQSVYPTNCTTCHSQNNWLEISFNHATTSFPLTGAHTSVICASCHTNGLKGTPTVCNSCHQKNYIAAQVPSHTAAGISNTCEICHTTSGWKPSSFNHITTGFELKGGHKTVVQCSDCHKGNLTAAKPECITCHQVQFDNAPNHKQGGYSTNCVTCHGSGSTSWKNAQIDHSFFPLTAGHAISCIQCHVTGIYGKLPANCNSCHQKNYTAAQIPGHIAAGIPNTCETCHTTTGWKPSSFNHTTTGYELKGGHKTVVQCSDCHKGNLTTATPECIKCHQVQYDNAPNHKQSVFPTNCTNCHSQNNWIEISFNHSTTNFPLSGAHTSVACALCHTSRLAGTSTVCSGCHQKNYTAAQIPNHTAAGIPNTCETCHTANGWKPSSFNHTSTGFELKGGHKTVVQCSDCHKGNLISAKTQCISCHQLEFNNAPNHKASGYPTDCTICHTTVNWLQSSFNHATTRFPLTGAHITVVCSSCHSSGFAGTPTACFSCHTTQYNNSTNPNHKAANFPTTCQTCHSTTRWVPSTFNHTSYFPITSGRHNVSCATCHTNTANYAVFTCITAACHAKAHNRNQGSTGCYTCHPTGKGD